MTLLELLQEFSDRQGLERPSTVMSTTDATVRQIRALANEVIGDITSRQGTWAKLQKEATFVSVAAESQGAIDTIAPYGFKFIIIDTLFDRTDRRPLFGPRNGPEWQENKALVFTGPYYTYRVWQGNFYMQPTPPAGHTIAFEYGSDMAIRGVTSSTDSTQIWKKRFSSDTDSFQLDDDLLLMGLRWKWRRAQGLSYKQEFDDFDYALTNYAGREPTAGPINLANMEPLVRPAIMVPSGNWNV